MKTLADSSNVVELAKFRGGLRGLRSVRYFSLPWHSALSSPSSRSSSDGVAGHCSSLGCHAGQTDSMIQLTQNASRIAVAVISTACATEKYASTYCCLVRLSSEFECSKHVTDESGETLVSGVRNDFTHGRCAYSIVVFMVRLELGAVLVAVGTTLIGVKHLLESDLELRFVKAWSLAVLGSLPPNDDRCCPVCFPGPGRTFTAVVRSDYRQESLSRLACRLDGSFRPL